MSKTTDLISAADAARVLNITPGGVGWLARTERLKTAARLPSGQRLYSRRAVERYAQQRRQQIADAVLASGTDAA